MCAHEPAAPKHGNCHHSLLHAVASPPVCHINQHMCIYTHISTHIQICLTSCLHMHPQVCLHLHLCTSIHASVHTSVHTGLRAHILTHVCNHASTHGHTSLHLQFPIHAPTHTHMHTHAHVHVHARVCVCRHAGTILRTARKKQFPSPLTSTGFKLWTFRSRTSNERGQWFR